MSAIPFLPLRGIDDTRGTCRGKFTTGVVNTGGAPGPYVFENTPKYSKLCMYRYGELSLLLIILLGLASQIKIFGEAPPKSKAN